MSPPRKPAPDAPAAADAVISDDLAEQVKKVLGTLTPREEAVLRQRFGIDGAKPGDDGGQDFEVTRERIREIERKALAKLKGRG